MSIRTRTASIVLVVVALLHGPALAGNPVKVAVALQPLYSIAAALAAGTSISIETVPEKMPGMGQLHRAFSRQAVAVGERLSQVDAVVTISSLWREDSLYREARNRNIRVVNIDAGRALGKAGASVMLTAQPASAVPWRKSLSTTGDSPYAWFSTANVIRMGEIVAADFAALAPDDKKNIDANLAALSAEMRALRTTYEAKFLEIENPQVFSLTDRFVYLTGEFGIFVEGHFLEDDVRWSAEDYAGLTRLLQDNNIRVVIHHWLPSDAIVEAISKGGARLLVMDDGEHSDGSAAASPDVAALQNNLRSNLDSLHKALSQP